jgi:hypothetical protein
MKPSQSCLFFVEVLLTLILSFPFQQMLFNGQMPRKVFYISLWKSQWICVFTVLFVTFLCKPFDFCRINSGNVTSFISGLGNLCFLSFSIFCFIDFHFCLYYSLYSACFGFKLLFFWVLKFLIWEFFFFAGMFFLSDLKLCVFFKYYIRNIQLIFMLYFCL